MPVVKIIKEINAPQNKVWNAISDIENAPEWVEVMQSLEETTDNPVNEGTVYKESSKIGPKESVTKWKVTRFDEPNVQIHECNEPDFQAKLTMQVQADGEKSKLIHQTEYKLMPKFRPLGALLENLFLKRSMNKSLNNSVDKLKSIVENNK